MSKYHREPEDIPTIGRVLNPMEGARNIEALRSLLRPGEVLVGYYDAHWRKIAPLLEGQADLDEFYRQYRMGYFVRMDYYAVREELLCAE